METKAGHVILTRLVSNIVNCITDMVSMAMLGWASQRTWTQSKYHPLLWEPGKHEHHKKSFGFISLYLSPHFHQDASKWWCDFPRSSRPLPLLSGELCRGISECKWKHLASLRSCMWGGRRSTLSPCKSSSSENFRTEIKARSSLDILEDTNGIPMIAYNMWSRLTD